MSEGGAIEEQVLHKNMQRFRGGLVFKAHRLLYHSCLGLRVIKHESLYNLQVVPCLLGGGGALPVPLT